MSFCVIAALSTAQSLQPVIQIPHAAQDSSEVKISPLLIALISEIDSLNFSKSNIPDASYLSSRNTPLFQVDKSARIHVTIKYDSDQKMTIRQIIELNGEVTAQNSSQKKITCWLDTKSIRNLAALPSIRNIRATERGHIRTGSVTSEGDTIHRTLAVRDAIGAAGAGITVGVISDGVDNLASAQSSGDLPLLINVIDNSEGGDEGTAMLEIIHDLAPFADLAFSEGIESSLEFINSINDLVAAGCDVVVDDIGYFSEPWFEEGPIASAARDAIENNGIIYVSSAGNSQDEHYENEFTASGPRFTLNDVHDFGGGDWGQLITVDGFASVTVFLQWNDPFGASTNEYRVHLANSDLSGLLEISSSRPDADEPYAVLGAVNNSPFPATANIAIERVAGSANRRIEMEYLITGSIDEYNTLPGSINGQPAVSDVIAAGAVRYNTPDLLEFFSSIGPSRIYSYPDYNFESRLKPDLVAVNGNQITGAGGFGQEFPPESGKIRFFGTSASAPHIAAGAAVVWSAYPELSNSQVRERLLNSAVDLGSSGYDFFYGYGRMDIQVASNSAPFIISGINGGSDALISGQITPGDTLAELTGYTLDAVADPFLTYFQNIQFSLLGTAEENDFEGFSLYVDTDKNGSIDPVTDSLLSNQNFSNPLFFDSIAYAFDNTEHTLILTANVSESANPDHVLSIGLNDSSDVQAFFGIDALDLNFPFSAADISLPVQLATFTAKLFEYGIQLKWTTLTELDTRMFEVERIIGSDRQLIGQTDAAGNSSIPQTYQFIDSEFLPANETKYMLYLIETDGQRILLAETAVYIPDHQSAALLPNIPNPFNTSTRIRFFLAIPSQVRIAIYNTSGQRVFYTNPTKYEPGHHFFRFNPSNLSSGIYYLQLITTCINGVENTYNQRMLLLK